MDRVGYDAHRVCEDDPPQWFITPASLLREAAVWNIAQWGKP
jgi:hypothetical protein